ncbi:hypothetical protein WA577_007464, partial [Blastocystis sp. JDR]
GDVALTVRTVTSFITDIVFNETPRVLEKDVVVVSSTDLPKHCPTISSDILLSATPPPAPVQLAARDALSVPMHLEYTQSHTSASGTLDVTERCECDVFVHLCVEWAHPSSPSPITHEYDLQVRLHPKPQIEIRYCVDAEMKLLQSNWVRVEVSNCSSHLHRHFQYPCVWQASGLT